MLLEGLSKIIPAKQTGPSNPAFIRYLFFTHGIGESEFNNTSIPYIMEIMKTHSYVKKEEEKAQKRANRKR